MAETSLAKNIQFMEPHIFCVMHIEMDDGKPFGHHLEGGIVVERFFADDDSSCMDRKVVGES